MSKENALNKIIQAVNILETIINNSRDGEWFEVAYGGEWAVENNVGSLVADAFAYGAEADLVVVTHEILPSVTQMLKMVYLLQEQVPADVFNVAVGIADRVVEVHKNDYKQVVSEGE